jgi:hypothetical protein
LRGLFFDKNECLTYLEVEEGGRRGEAGGGVFHFQLGVEVQWIRWALMRFLLSAFDVVEAGLVALLELGVAKGDGVLALGHFLEAVHVELHDGKHTCRRKDW